MKLARALRHAVSVSLSTCLSAILGASAANATATPSTATSEQPWLDLFSSVTPYLLATALGAIIIHLLTLKRRVLLEINASHDKEVRTKQQLERTQRRLRATFDNAVVGIALARPDGRFIEVNARFTGMIGYSSEEICALDQLAITHPEDIANSRQQFDALVTGKIAFYTIDKRLVRKDGSNFWASISVAPIFAQHSEGGDIESVICITQDIHERKLTEERLQRILGDLPIATLVVDAARRITHQSAKFSALFGYAVDEVTSVDSWLPLAYPDPAYRAQAKRTGSDIVAVSRQTGHASGPVELRVRCKDGTSKEIQFHYVDLLDMGIWMMNDITEQNDMEESMRAINDHLMERLGEISGLQEQLRKQAMHDSLTGLFNRRYLDEMLERELARAKREGPPLTVMMLDIDHFKKLNDTYGHQAGDEVLRSLADLLRNHSRAEDIPCRYGGEEFLLVLPNMSRDDAVPRAEQWRREFAAMRITFGNATMSSTISIGVATFPDHGNTRNVLIEAADKALYVAKHNGRNRVEICAD